MPAKINRKPAARAARNRAHTRKDKAKQGFKRNKRSKATAPAVIANSVFALTLADKPALEVIEKVEEKKNRHRSGDQDDYYQMYHDLLKAFKNGVKLVSGETTECDPLASGLGIGMSLAYVMRGFEHNILPKEFDYKIDLDEDGNYYHFTIYRYCQFSGWWHAFEIMPICRHLKRHNQPLLKLFLSFISYMSMRLDIQTWWNGGCGYAEYMMEERLMNWEDNEGDIKAPKNATKQQKEYANESRKRYETAVKNFKDYKNGEPREYEKLIRASRGSSAAAINKSLSGFNRKDPVVAFMIKMMDFMEKPGSISDYIYRESDDDGEMGLAFDQQIAIIWDWDDEYTRCQMDCIDAEASGIGVMPPMLHYYITPHTKKLDKDELDEWLKWPGRLSALWEEYNNMIKKFKPKKQAKK